MIMILNDNVNNLLSEVAKDKLKNFVKTIIGYEFSYSDIKQIEIDMTGKHWEIFIITTDDSYHDWQYELDFIFKEII